MILGLTKRMILVDAETSSGCDLKKHGSDRYWADPSTRCLMLGFQEFGTGDAYLYQPHLHDLPRLLVEAAALPPEECLFTAYNANFDRHAMALAGIPTPAAKWFDIMLAAYTLAFSGGLNDVLKQFEVRGRDGALVQKHPEGARLIGEFSKQQKPWYESPTNWDLFARYCVQDVEVEALLLEKCLWLLDRPHFHTQMQTLQGQWLQDQAMNARGMPVSTATVKGALAIKEIESKRLTARLGALTGLTNPNSTQQLHGWLTQQEATLPDLQAATVREALGNPDLPPRVREVLGMRLELSKASVKKYDAFERMEVGGRIRNCYTTAGASRTGRTASRGVNLSNLERPKLSSEIADSTCNLIEIGDPDLLTAWTPSKLSVMEILGSCVRGAIAAPPGRAFAVADLKSIESVGVAWLAGCDTILDIFWDGRGTYEEFASRYYGVPYDAVTKSQRTFCKPIILGFGYGASGPAIVTYAAGMGIEILEEDADRAIALTRDVYPEIPLLWRNVEDAAKRAIRQPGTTHKAFACDTMSEWGPTYKEWPYCSFYYNGTFLYAGLPSGRTLFYYKPEIKRVQRTSRKTGNDYWAENINYWGKRQESGGAWSFISTHGGMLVENLTQALCRDVLYNGLRLLEPHKNIEIVGTTYDEIITLSSVETSVQTLGTLVECMTTLPTWADSRFFLGADGYHTAKRYRK